MLTDLPAWRALEEHCATAKRAHLRDLFAADSNRRAALSIEACGLLFDYSKNRVTTETMELLAGLGEACDLPGRRRALFSGQHVNNTEGRAALHMALRRQGRQPFPTEGRGDVSRDAREVLRRMRGFADAVLNGEITGKSGKPFTDVVNIGIGGSYLGAALVCEALGSQADHGMRVRFISDIDGKELADGLRGLDAERTLFIVSSKTFTTQETMANAAAARRWVNAAYNDESAWQKHFAAVTADTERACDFGVGPDYIFPIWEWVGGRYSLWSAMGLPIVFAAGWQRFEQLLQGAAEMDRHFLEAAPLQNMPVVMALLDIWYINFFGATTHAILPYDARLARLPAYLQQLEMESNGKQTTRAGEPAPYPTAPVIWGQSGTNGQHAFFQLLHQGSGFIPADFIAPMQTPYDAKHHEILLSHCFAQAQALMRGKTRAQAKAELEAQGLRGERLATLLPHKVFPGNRPSNMIVFPRLDARALGSLLACYEHKVFTQSVIWDINAFDQWGVELGKALASGVLPALSGAGMADGHDGSTRGLIEYYRRHKR